MTQRVIELAQIKLAEGKTEQDLATASDAFQERFLEGQVGFLSRHLVRRGEGAYLDIILWESREHADAVFAKAQKSEAAGQYFSVMDFDTQSDDPGVEHCPILRSFTAA